MVQSWYSLLFAHWPVPAESLRSRIPPELELDLHGGEAWLGIVPFGMCGIRLRGLPPIPGASAFLELNVRTYVRERGSPDPNKTGVWFLSLDAASPLAVAAARAWFHLPYFRAAMSIEEGEWISYRSRRTHRGATPAGFEARYRATGDVFRSSPGSLESFLTDRFALYAVGRRGRLVRGEIEHAPWPLQPAEAEFSDNRMAQCHGIALPATKPLLHFSRRLDVRIGSPGPAAA
jgi:uncharacterized protein YqjF (DUF2071 family)